MRDQHADSENPLGTPLQFDHYDGESTQGWAFEQPIGKVHVSRLPVWNNPARTYAEVSNVRVGIDYIHYGKLTYSLQDVLWRCKYPSIDLKPDYIDHFPVFIIPDRSNTTVMGVRTAYVRVGDTMESYPLEQGRWMARITVTADEQPPLNGEVEFTVLESQIESGLIVRCNDVYGAARLPIESPELVVRAEKVGADTQLRHSEPQAYGEKSLELEDSGTEEEINRAKIRSAWLNDKLAASEDLSSDYQIAGTHKGPTYNTIRRWRTGKKSSRDLEVRKGFATVFNCDIRDVPE